MKFVNEDLTKEYVLNPYCGPKIITEDDILCAYENFPEGAIFVLEDNEGSTLLKLECFSPSTVFTGKVIFGDIIIGNLRYPVVCPELDTLQLIAKSQRAVDRYSERVATGGK